SFARNWMAEYNAGLPRYNEYKKADGDHLLETTGKELRKLMSWMNEDQ
ncbi:ketol-acid reductoisomerase, partial [Streptomyces sp. 6N223]